MRKDVYMANIFPPLRGLNLEKKLTTFQEISFLLVIDLDFVKQVA